MISIWFVELFTKCFSVQPLLINSEQVRLTRVFDFYGNEKFLNAFLFDDKYSKEVGDGIRQLEVAVLPLCTILLREQD